MKATSTMKLMMKDLFGEDCLSPDDGQKAYESIHPELQAGRDVTLDFSGVRVVASPFLNQAIGKLYADISPECIREHLDIVELNDPGKFALRRVVDNSKSYYKDEKMRDAVDHSISILEA
jgi:hypothetical protein